MAGVNRFGMIVVLACGLAAGCNRGASSDASAKADGGSGGDAIESDFSNNPIARVASEFLDAVLKGDMQRGSARLTPKALERIMTSGKQFDPPGVENPRFRVVGVGMATRDHAFVQCEFNYVAQGAVHNEDMACELRLVNNNWCVSGIAYGISPDKPWNLYDFETDKDRPIPRQASAHQNATSAQDFTTAGRPSPPRTAQEMPPTGSPADRR